MDGAEELTEPSSLEEQLDELCLYYMSMGVPYETFWYGNICSLKYYEEVYMRQRKIHNEEMWMMGAYNFASFGTAIGNAFRGRGQQAHDYLKEPIHFFPETEMEKKIRERVERQKLINFLNGLERSFKNVTKNSGS